jgi:hypothetical protein
MRSSGGCRENTVRETLVPLGCGKSAVGSGVDEEREPISRRLQDAGQRSTTLQPGTVAEIGLASRNLVPHQPFVGRSSPKDGVMGLFSKDIQTTDDLLVLGLQDIDGA